jgi:hypothetical protein
MGRIRQTLQRWLARSLWGDTGWNQIGSLLEGAAPTGVSTTNRPAESIVLVYGCLQARADAIASVPLRLTDDDENLIESGPVWDLLTRPYLGATWNTYVRQLETHSTLYNTIAILPGRDGARVVELMPLNPGYLRAEGGVHGPSGVQLPVAWLYRDPHTGAERRFEHGQHAAQIGRHRGLLEQSIESDPRVTVVGLGAV